MDGSAREIYWQDWLSNKNFTTLWVDGNHENFDILYEFPLTDKFGGKVREIAPSIYHLDRGQVLTVDGCKIFVMGGARSIDKSSRNRAHFVVEAGTPQEQRWKAVRSLDEYDWCVDYVITHCAPRSIQSMISPWYENDPMVSFLERIYSDISFKRWFFGHYHVDKELGDNFVALYNKVIPIVSLP